MAMVNLGMCTTKLYKYAIQISQVTLRAEGLLVGELRGSHFDWEVLRSLARNFSSYNNYLSNILDKNQARFQIIRGRCQPVDEPDL